MTPSEAELMQKHTAYWQDLADRGIALVVGPVLDPAGIWGIAIIDAKDADAAAALTSDDPVIAGGGGFRYDIHLVPQAILRTTHQPNPL
ncbi:hypothetical protein KBI52_28565 [Microvirga sp. HBU67558]|nr:YciI family protein [Microvirga sp. HBU67558]MBQ0824155.1 hypothetical protein [Microvirga sp. HBU67558]